MSIRSDALSYLAESVSDFEEGSNTEVDTDCLSYFFFDFLAYSTEAICALEDLDLRDAARDDLFLS